MTWYIFRFTEKDYATHNFLPWYVNEQIEEERLARTMNDKLEMIGDHKSGLYLFEIYHELSYCCQWRWW